MMLTGQTGEFKLYADDVLLKYSYASGADAKNAAHNLSNHNPNARIEVRTVMGVLARFVGGQEVPLETSQTREDRPHGPARVDDDNPPETPADVLTDALAADPNYLTGEMVNAMYERLELAIYGLPKAAVLRIIPGGRDE
jgi:hypothetical protein